MNDFYKFLIKQIILSDRISLIEERKNIYGKNLNLKEIKEIQISNFNKVWSYSHNNIFFYKNWKKKHRLPSEIKSFGIKTVSDYWEISLRNINDDSIFCQNLISQGWSNKNLLKEKSFFLPKIKKAVINIIDADDKMLGPTWQKLNNNYVLEKNVSEFWHCYISNNSLPNFLIS